MNRREKAARKARKKKDRQKAHRAPSARAPLPIDPITLAPSVHMDCGGERVPATCAEYKARIESSLVMTADGKKTALELCNEPGHTHMRCLKCGQVSHIGGYMSSFDFDDDGELEMMGDLDEDDEGEPCCIECGSTEHLVRHDEGCGHIVCLPCAAEDCEDCAATWKRVQQEEART